MLNFLKKSIKTVKEAAHTVTVQEIHETFFTEVDVLMKSAKVPNSLETDKQELINKCERLRKLGFTHTKEVLDAEEEISRLEALKIENQKKDSTVAAINYFSQKYPLYKFITVESVKKICTKYGLVLGPIEKYKGTVPDKSLKQMENFKIEMVDTAYFYKRGYERDFSKDQITTYDVYQTKELEQRARTAELYKMENREARNEAYRNARDIGYEFKSMPLEIAAPLTDFDMTKSELIGQEIVKKAEVPDPVVLKPVMYREEKYFLIMAAWGDEASDKEIVNENFN